MKGTMFLKKLNKRQRCIVSDKDYDEKVGGEFWFVLDPFLNCEDKPFFYYKQIENGYIVEGEAYICTDENSVQKHRLKTNRLYRTITYIENQNLNL